MEDVVPVLMTKGVTLYLFMCAEHDDRKALDRRTPR
jgi:hypothetical protein